MEKRNEVLKEIQKYCKTVSTGLGEMFIGYDSWNELAGDAEVVGGEIYLLKKRNGERVYQVLGKQHEPYDRENDYTGENVVVFNFTKDTDKLLKNVFERCFSHRFEDAINGNDYDAVQELTDDFNRCKSTVDFFTSEDSLLVIDEYLLADVIERYPMRWCEDVWEYRLALKLNDEEEE